MTETKQALLPCPFCGSVNTYIEEVAPHTHKVATFMPDYQGGAMATCGACAAAHWRDGKDALAEVVAAWNLRANGPAIKAALEDARRWRKLGADCFGDRTDHPCLRDDLADWCREQGMDDAAIDAMAAGEDAK